MFSKFLLFPVPSHIATMVVLLTSMMAVYPMIEKIF